MHGATERLVAWITAELERQQPALDALRGLARLTVEVYVREGELEDIRVEPRTVHKRRRPV